MNLNDPLFIFGAISSLFLAGLVVQALFSVRFCALCASVSGTWIPLLLLYKLGLFKGTAALGILMGCSVVGVYYLVEKKTPEKLHLFRLPFFLSLTAGVFALLGLFPSPGRLLVFLLLLWILFGLIYGWREQRGIGQIAQRLIKCCKNW